MPSIYTLDALNVTVSGGGSLSGITQGDASHLAGLTITLNSNAWNVVDINDNDGTFDDNDTGQTLNGAQTINGVLRASGTVAEAEYRIVVQDPSGNQYTIIGFNIREPGAPNAFGTIEGLAFIGPIGGFPPIGVALTVVSTGEGPGPTSNATPFGSYATPPCFTPGTLIDTPHGPVPVEALCRGDMVITQDDGPQRLRWIGRVSYGRHDLAAQPSLWPVRIAAGAFGPGRPARDLVVSPQHRVLVGGWRAELHFGCAELLVAALHLVNGTTVTRIMPKAGVSYIHLLFDRHQIVTSEGLATESYFPGRQTMQSLPSAARAELFELFPQVKGSGNLGPAARPGLTAWEAAVLVA